MHYPNRYFLSRLCVGPTRIHQIVLICKIEHQEIPTASWVTDSNEQAPTYEGCKQMHHKACFKGTYLEEVTSTQLWVSGISLRSPLSFRDFPYFNGLLFLYFPLTLLSYLTNPFSHIHVPQLYIFL